VSENSVTITPQELVNSGASTSRENHTTSNHYRYIFIDYIYFVNSQGRNLTFTAGGGGGGGGGLFCMTKRAWRKSCPTDILVANISFPKMLAAGGGFSLSIFTNLRNLYIFQ
jgi:hypothetical protein